MGKWKWGCCFRSTLDVLFGLCANIFLLYIKNHWAVRGSWVAELSRVTWCESGIRLVRVQSSPRTKSFSCEQSEKRRAESTTTIKILYWNSNKTNTQEEFDSQHCGGTTLIFIRSFHASWHPLHYSFTLLLVDQKPLLAQIFKPLSSVCRLVTIHFPLDHIPEVFNGVQVWSLGWS